MRAVTAEEIMALAKRADMTVGPGLADDLYAVAWRNFPIGYHVELGKRGEPSPEEMAAAARKYADRILLTEVF